MRARFSTVLGLALLWAAMACDNDEPSSFVTGVDRDKPLGTVTGPEAQAVCEATQSWSREAIPQEKQRDLTCKITATLAASVGTGGGGAGAGGEAQLRVACQMAYDQCTMAPLPADTAPAMCQGFPTNCTATVAEYEACLNDLPPFVDQTLPMLPSCETLNAISILAVANLINTLPATCRTFQMKCRGATIGGLPTTLGPTPP
jgi:hypothetical protein